MDKKIFPGGEAQKLLAQKRREKAEQLRARAENRAAQRAEKEQKRRAAKAQRKKRLQDMGAATRLLIVRREFNNFVAGLLVAFGMGSAYWGITNIELSGAERTSYTDAVRRAYDVTILTDASRRGHTDASGLPDGLYTFVSVLMVVVAGVMARAGAKRDMRIADKATQYLNNYMTGNQLNFPLVSNLTGLSKYKNEKLHPICCAVIKEMATKNPILFDRLLSGMTPDVTQDYAISVIQGYLKSHPDDFQRVLDVYDADSLPKSLVCKYGQRTR